MCCLCCFRSVDMHTRLISMGTFNDVSTSGTLSRQYVCPCGDSTVVISSLVRLPGGSTRHLPAAELLLPSAASFALYSLNTHSIRPCHARKSWFLSRSCVMFLFPFSDVRARGAVGLALYPFFLPLLRLLGALIAGLALNSLLQWHRIRLSRHVFFRFHLVPVFVTTKSWSRGL